MSSADSLDLSAIKNDLRREALALGFDAMGVAEIALSADEQHLLRWLDAGFHGEMSYMARHDTRRSQPAQWAPGAVRSISFRMNYWPATAQPAEEVLSDSNLAYVSRYALGRDYHKVLRQALHKLADSLAVIAAAHGYRVCVDSAPVLEKALARDAGLGWIGKHTNLIARHAGSYFFLGEILTDLPLAADAVSSSHCGSCSACIPACPTAAIVAPYQLDARRCISYLTIEYRGAIPLELRRAIGNRIYGCDDCQLVCPWNKYAQAATHPDFRPRQRLDRSTLLELFAWSELEFQQRLQGTAIYRIGYECWLRNIAVALGNTRPEPAVIAALESRLANVSELVREHVLWALHQLRSHAATSRHADHANQTTQQ
jgi:epoxyqueuosine reductase